MWQYGSYDRTIYGVEMIFDHNVSFGKINFLKITLLTLKASASIEKNIFENIDNKKQCTKTQNT